jgi:hypothetical protein
MDSETEPPAGTDSPLLHRLVFAGKLVPGFEEAAVREALARHLRRAPTELFTGKRVVVSEDLDAGEADVARQALEALGARVLVETVEAPPPMAPLSFLDVAAPAPPPEDTVSKDDLALTDSGWQALSQALEPLPDPAQLPPLDLGDAAAGPGPLIVRDFVPGSFPSASFPPAPSAAMSPAAEPPASSAALRAPNAKPMEAAPSRPPTDLSSVFGSAAPPPPPAGEASPVFAPIAKAPLPPPMAAPLPSPSPVRETLPVSDLAMTDALPAPVAGIPEAALLVTCPNCRERQPMRVLCRACGSDLQRALAAQQEERDQARPARGTGAAAARAGGPAKGPRPASDDGLRLLGWRVPDHIAERITLGNGVLALFGLLLALAAVGFVWRQVRPDPVSSSTPKVAEAAASGAAADPGLPSASASAPSMGPPPSEADVASRLHVAAAVGEFRLNYWPKAANKVFVASGDATWAWRAGMPSVTRALSEALSECDSRRPPEAPDCKVVNLNNYWQE